MLHERPCQKQHIVLNMKAIPNLIAKLNVTGTVKAVEIQRSSLFVEAKRFHCALTETSILQFYTNIL